MTLKNTSINQSLYFPKGTKIAQFVPELRLDFMIQPVTSPTNLKLSLQHFGMANQHLGLGSTDAYPSREGSGLVSSNPELSGPGAKETCQLVQLHCEI